MKEHYLCKYREANQLSEEVLLRQGIQFPDIHLVSDQMQKYAMLIKEDTGSPYVKIPFCTTVEADAFGAIINYGNGCCDPRISEHKFSSFEELKGIKPIDFNSGRIKQVLETIKELSAGNQVIVNVSGPLSILAMLMDSQEVFKGLIKNKTVLKEVSEIVSADIVRFANEAMENGAAIISYADPLGTKDIVGPKVFREYCGPVNSEIIQQISKNPKCGGIHVCGKLSSGLEKEGFLEFELVDRKSEQSYLECLGDAIKNNGCGRIYGHGCIEEI